RRRHTRFSRDWSSDVCSSDLCLCGSERRFGLFGLQEKFLSCLCGSEQVRAMCEYISIFLSCLCGSEQVRAMCEYISIFLSCLCEIGRASCRERVRTTLVV